MINFLKQTNIYIVSLLPFFLVTGPFLTDLCVCLSGLLFLIFISFEKKWDYVLNKYFIFYIIWCIYIILLSLFSTDPYLSLESSLFYWRFGFFALSIYYLLDNDQSFLKKFTNFFIIIYAFVLLDGYIQFFLGYDFFGNQYQGDRLSALFGKEKILGSYLSRLLPILFALVAICYKNSKLTIYLMMIALILTDALIYLSGERTSFFYLLISSIIIIIYTKNWKLIRTMTLIFSIIIIFIISIYNISTKKRMIDYTIEQTNILGEKVNLFSAQHEVIYGTSLKIFKDNYFFGIGPKIFRLKCQDYLTFTDQDPTVNGCQTHPHNTYIQLLVETGIIGSLPIFLLFFCVLYVFFKNSVNLLKKNNKILSDYQVCLITAVFISLWPLVPTGNFFNNWLSAIYYLPLGFLLHSVKKGSIKL